MRYPDSSLSLSLGMGMGMQVCFTFRLHGMGFSSSLGVDGCDGWVVCVVGGWVSSCQLYSLSLCVCVCISEMEDGKTRWRIHIFHPHGNMYTSKSL